MAISVLRIGSWRLQRALPDRGPASSACVMPSTPFGACGFVAHVRKELALRQRRRLGWSRPASSATFACTQAISDRREESEPRHRVSVMKAVISGV
jgi:hypothetical protein